MHEWFCQPETEYQFIKLDELEKYLHPNFMYPTTANLKIHTLVSVLFYTPSDVQQLGCMMHEGVLHLLPF